MIVIIVIAIIVIAFWFGEWIPNMCPPNQECHNYDMNGNGGISFGEFMQYWQQKTTN